jgi:hypothetical protein
MMEKSKKLKRIFVIISLCAVAVILSLSCEVDHGLGPSKTKITGQVKFNNQANRPDNVDEVRVVTTAATDLTDLNLGDFYSSTAVRFDLDSTRFEIAAPVGTYPLIGVLWKARGKNWDINNIIGIYNPKCDNTLDPLSVQLTAESPVADSVNICAFWQTQ